LPHEETHAPWKHTLPLLHCTPQLPQFFGSFSLSTQPPLHAVSVVPQLLLHFPLSQTSPVLHASVHAPQCAVFVWRFVQRSAPQSVSVPEHVGGSAGNAALVAHAHAAALTINTADPRATVERSESQFIMDFNLAQIVDRLRSRISPAEF